MKGLVRNIVDYQWRYYDDACEPLIVQNIKTYLAEKQLEPYIMFYKLSRNMGI